MRPLTCLSRHWRVTAAALVVLAALLGAVGLPGSLATAGLRQQDGLPAAPAAKATIGTVIKPGGSSVRAIAVDPKTHTVWAGVATTGKSDFVAKISETSKRVLAKFPVPKGVSAIAVDPTTGTVWVTSSTSLVVTEITESTSASHSVSLAKSDTSIAAVTVDPATGLAFVFTANGLVIRIAEATRAVHVIALSTNESGQGGVIGVDRVRGEVWTAGFSISTNATEVQGFNEDGAQLDGPITLGSGPVVAMTVDPTAGRLWVSDRGDNGNLELTEVGEQSASIAAGPFLNFKLPIAVAADPPAGAIWVADLIAGTVSRITESKGRAGIGGPVAVGSFALSVAADPGTGKVFVGGYQIGDGRNVGTVTAFTPAAPAFTSPSSAWFAAGAKRAETFRVTTSGFPAPRFAFVGPAPSWLTIGGQTGVLKVTQGPGPCRKNCQDQNYGGERYCRADNAILLGAPRHGAGLYLGRQGEPARRKARQVHGQGERDSGAGAQGGQAPAGGPADQVRRAWPGGAERRAVPHRCRPRLPGHDDRD